MRWDVATLKDLEKKVWRCTACGTCKSAYEYGSPPHANAICPAGVEYGFEGYLASKGKIAYARGILDGQLEWNEELVDAVFKCTICGGCQAQCQLDHKPFIPDIIEAIRRDAVAAGVGPMPSQKVVTQSLGTYDNPYQGAAPSTHRLDSCVQEGRATHTGHQEAARRHPVLGRLHGSLQRVGPRDPGGDRLHLPEAGPRFRHPRGAGTVLWIDRHAAR